MVEVQVAPSTIHQFVGLDQLFVAACVLASNIPYAGEPYQMSPKIIVQFHAAHILTKVQNSIGIWIIGIGRSN